MPIYADYITSIIKNPLQSLRPVSLIFDFVYDMIILTAGQTESEWVST